MECSQKGGTDKYERAAQDDCGKNSPKEHVVAILVRHREIREDDQKDEEVIDAERPLDEGIP